MLTKYKHFIEILIFKYDVFILRHPFRFLFKAQPMNDFFWLIWPADLKSFHPNTKPHK